MSNIRKVTRPRGKEVSSSGASTDQISEKPKLLFLDDEERIVNALRAIFRSKYDVFTATSSAEALDVLRANRIAVVVSDQRMPGMTGVEFLREAKVVSPDTLRILLTGFSDLRAIIDSVNEGEVFRFLNKPWGNQEIQVIIDEAVNVALETQGEASESESGGVLAVSGSIENKSNQAIPKALVVIRCRDLNLFNELKQEAGEEFELLHVKSQEEALSVLQTRPVSVLVTTLDEDDLSINEDSAEFLKQLKRELPELLTIGMAFQADHEKVVELINQAKVHRYVVLPSRVSRILFFIRSAADQHRRFVANPTLLGRQGVEIKPLKKGHEIPEAVLSSIRSIRKIFSQRTV